MAHRWTKTQTDFLDELRTRYADHNGRNRVGGNRRMSERQYVIARFQEKRRNELQGDNGFRWGRINENLSDQAIWAKYNRLGGAKVVLDGKFNAKVASEFLNADGLSLFSGFGSDAEFEVWSKLLDGLGLKRLGSGISRTVWDLGDGKNVVKIAHRPDMNHNRREVKYWEKFANKADGKFLAPVIACDDNDRWLVMAKAEVKADFVKGTPRELRQAANRMNITDMHAGNVGRFDGRNVIIDYACGF